MRVDWRPTAVPGVLRSIPAVSQDSRGTFTKISSGFDSSTSEFVGREFYWTSSQRGVIRGLHFQLPPASTSKLIYVAHGSIRDFIVDLRVGSPVERELFEFELGAGDGGLLIPPGCAHAYESLEEGTIVCYAQDIPFDSTATYAGIRYDSAGIVPRSSAPLVLERDLGFPTLEEFDSPFLFHIQ